MENTNEDKKTAFNEAAHEHYVENTEKSHAQLEHDGYIIGHRHDDWAANLDGDEWPTIEKARKAGIHAADLKLENEAAAEPVNHWEEEELAATTEPDDEIKEERFFL